LHELSLCQAIADSAVRHADGRPLTSVLVQVGHLRQVVPDSLAFAWEMLTAGTQLEGCALEIDHVAATVSCDACGETSTLRWPTLQCSACESTDVVLLTGDELLVVSIELARSEVS
jgi:hydrogenase nickel incorporation protein HypA/HybF